MQRWSLARRVRVGDAGLWKEGRTRARREPRSMCSLSVPSGWAQTARPSCQADHWKRAQRDAPLRGHLFLQGLQPGMLPAAGQHPPQEGLPAPSIHLPCPPPARLQYSRQPPPHNMTTGEHGKDTHHKVLQSRCWVSSLILGNASRSRRDQMLAEHSGYHLPAPKQQLNKKKPGE